eukprot:scaffold290259_cov43-Prasinocladus_malaysianus.AAC.1
MHACRYGRCQAIRGNGFSDQKYNCACLDSLHPIAESVIGGSVQDHRLPKRQTPLSSDFAIFLMYTAVKVVCICNMACFHSSTIR